MNLSNDQRLQLFSVLQKVFILGVMTGQNQLAGAQQPESQIAQAAAGAMANLQELIPGSSIEALLAQISAGMLTK